MKWLILALVVVVVLAVLLALVLRSARRRKQEVARTRAGELRSEAADVATQHREQDAVAREREAEAARVRAQADRLEAEADRERTAVDQTRAHHEDRIREADRLDPDVDHRSANYRPEPEQHQPGRADALDEQASRPTGHDQRDQQGLDGEHDADRAERGGYADGEPGRPHA